MKQMQYEIVNTAEKLLMDKKVDIFIGYENGTLPLRTSPCFITEQGEARKLVWNSLCSNNLSVYAPISMSASKRPTRVGILCKGCDSRSIVNLIKEKQVNKDNLVIVGISCSGIVNSNKILSCLDGKEILATDEDLESITIKLENGEKRFEKREYLYEPCRTCTHPTPSVYDILIRAEGYTPQPVASDQVTEEFRSKSREERWRIFENEISRCVRCYACRKVCPNCYCKECFAEQTKPKWVGVTNELSDLLFYHMVRIFHQAGRCVDCGACVRACPMNIDLRLFTHMLVDMVKERFGYEPGLSIKDSAPLATFSINDKQEFMIEPE